MPTVVLVDDDVAFRRVIVDALTELGHQVIGAEDAESALFELTKHAVDAAVVDMRLPGMDGVAFIREVRRRGATPLIALSGRSTPDDEARALDAGADTYVVKPVSVDELDLRIRSLVRRSHGGTRGELVVGRMTIRPDVGHVEIDGRRTSLEPADMRLLVELATSPGVVHSREQLRERVFGTEAWVVTSALERHIRRLRAVVEAEPTRPRHIVAVRGSGYRFVP